MILKILDGLPGIREFLVICKIIIINYPIIQMTKLWAILIFAYLNYRKLTPKHLSYVLAISSN